MQLRGTNAIITGASRGIGVYIARALAAEGVSLALVARSAEPIQQLAAELARSGVTVVAVAGDLERESEHERLFARCEAELGPIDILINNAAIEFTQRFEEAPNHEIMRTLQLDLAVPILLSRRALPAMLARKRGQIVNIASLAGKSPTPYEAVYSAAKGGLIAFTHSLRAELHETGVSASVVSPGFVSEAGMFFSKQQTQGVASPNALVGMSAPEQVARAVVRALQHDLPDVIVNPGPMRALQAVSALFPRFGGWLSRRVGVAALFRSALDARPVSGARTSHERAHDIN